MPNRCRHAILDGADVREALALFAGYGVRYLIFGGCAVIWYSKPRYTHNVDIWTASDELNARAVFAVLGHLGAPLTGLFHEDFRQPGFYYQMGRPPIRIDDMPTLRGVSFEDAWKERESMAVDGVDLNFISRRHLIQVKRAAGRPQDIVDLRQLDEGSDPMLCPEGA
jgi:hypothetical protein